MTTARFRYSKGKQHPLMSTEFEPNDRQCLQRDTLQAIIRQLPTVAARVRFQERSRGIRGR
jgi:hypothetical protein